MWFSKWGWASVFTETNIIKDTFDVIVYRISGDGSNEIPIVHDWTIFNAIKVNFEYFNTTKFWVVMLCFAACILIFSAYKKKIKFNYTSLLILGVAILPFVWFAVLSNHSIIHPHMVYREVSISAFAIMSVIASCFSKRKDA